MSFLIDKSKHSKASEIVRQKINLRFKESDIHALASRYRYPKEDDKIINMKSVIQKRGYLTKNDLYEVAKWKAERIAGHTLKNPDDFVKEVTSCALRATDERTRIDVLTVLDGVQWPMASVILHFFHNDRYPILDFRVLWSVSLEKPTKYSLSFWWPYVQFCRVLADRNQIDMRTLDRALWQYSDEN